MGIQRVSHITIIVKDQDEALKWYTENLGFEKRSDDTQAGTGFRWLTVAPKGQKSPEVILFRARDQREQSWVGQGTLWVLETNDCRGMCKELSSRGVKILNQPEEHPWGVSAIIEDLYGNPYNLLQPKSAG